MPVTPHANHLEFSSTPAPTTDPRTREARPLDPRRLFPCAEGYAMTARVSLVAILAAVLTIWCSRARAPHRPTTPRLPRRLRQRPALAEAPQVPFARTSPHTVRDGERESGRRRAGRRAIAYDASWIRLAALVRVCSDRAAGARRPALPDGHTTHRGQSMNRRPGVGTSRTAGGGSGSTGGRGVR